MDAAAFVSKRIFFSATAVSFGPFYRPSSSSSGVLVSNEGNLRAVPKGLRHQSIQGIRMPMGISGVRRKKMPPRSFVVICSLLLLGACAESHASRGRRATPQTVYRPGPEVVQPPRNSRPLYRPGERVSPPMGYNPGERVLPPGRYGPGEPVLPPGF